MVQNLVQVWSTEEHGAGRSEASMKGVTRRSPSRTRRSGAQESSLVRGSSTRSRSPSRTRRFGAQESTSVKGSSTQSRSPPSIPLFDRNRARDLEINAPHASDRGAGGGSDAGGNRSSSKRVDAWIKANDFLDDLYGPRAPRQTRGIRHKRPPGGPARNSSVSAQLAFQNGGV
jgi:hypothetical protein